MVELATCRSCGADGLLDLGPCAPILPSHAVSIGGEPLPAGRLFRCRQCGLGQRQPCPDASQLAELYGCSPADAMEYRFEENGAWTAARRYLEKRWSRDGEIAVLDVGCHTGLFLAGLAPNWKRYGVEGARAPSSVARGRDVTIIADWLEEVPSEWNGKFDAVTLFDVVEHLPDPAGSLARAASLLRPSGALVVGTADLDAWTWKVSEGRHWYLQEPQHVSILSRQFLGHVADRCNLDLSLFTRVPHQVGEWRTRLNECIETIYAGLRDRGGWYRLPQRLLLALPGLGRLRFMQEIRWAATLRDHMFAVLVSKAQAQVPIASPVTYSRAG